MSSISLCGPPKTNSEKSNSYDQYYIGERDKEKRKNGFGENHWTGPESLEWYEGDMMKDTMHGIGEYRLRYRGPDSLFVTYEGNFYANHYHGYGSMSYPDGATFSGIFHSNVRWGPGVVSHVNLHEDVGLWCGTQLIRLTWKPTQSIIPYLCLTELGRNYVESFRTKLMATCKTIGKTNSALDLLKKCGAEPQIAAEMWKKIYPKHCTDLQSQLCPVDAFENQYYEGTVRTLEVEDGQNIQIEIVNDNPESGENNIFFAWNNNYTIINMMQHCYKHEHQRKSYNIDLEKILSGPRQSFKSPGKQEIDCRILLMASYLGHIPTVVRLINESGVHPDVSDSQGNTALIYATCGSQADIIRFLTAAGANVNCFNDSCCTPLAVALFFYACAQKDIDSACILQAILPPSTESAPALKVTDWIIKRQVSLSTLSPLKPATKNNSNKKLISKTNLKDSPIHRMKSNVTSIKEGDYDSEDSSSENKGTYINTKHEYDNLVSDIFHSADMISVPYIFEVNNMVNEINYLEVIKETKTNLAVNNKKKGSKVMSKQASKVAVLKKSDNIFEVNSAEKLRNERLQKMILSLFLLLHKGADPNLVNCPQPALFMAIVSGSTKLVKILIKCGASVNEVYHHVLDYTPLDIAVSLPFTHENMEIVKVLLEHDAYTRRRLPYCEDNEQEPETIYDKGPTLLHAVLARRTESEIEEEVQMDLIELLLNYNCDYLAQYKGKSAIDFAMTEYPRLFNTFVRNTRVDLNSVINDENQNILVKFFTVNYFVTVDSNERLQFLTNLLLFGADPLKQCQNEDNKYFNVFQYSKSILNELKNMPIPTANKQDTKGKMIKPSEDKDKKGHKSKITDKSKPTTKFGADDLADYKQAMDLMKECARLMHIRWLQAKLMKDIIDTVLKYRHRDWTMILKELKDKKNIGLWLNTQRCLEIWDIFKATKRKCCSYTASNNILKKILHIVQFANKHSGVELPYKLMTSKEKNSIEREIYWLLNDYRMSHIAMDESTLWNTPYVKPELNSRYEKKFNVCFECDQPFTQTKIGCVVCKLVSFCCEDCLKKNTSRVSCHPCSIYLAAMFPSPAENGGEEMEETI